MISLHRNWSLPLAVLCLCAVLAAVPAWAQRAPGVVIEPEWIEEFRPRPADTPSAWPWMAAFNKTGYRLEEGATCVGALIHERWLLTVAHCFPEGNRDGVEIVLGLNNWAATGGQRLFPQRIVLHPRFDRSKHDFDVALVELMEPVTGVAPLALGGALDWSREAKAQSVVWRRPAEEPEHTLLTSLNYRTVGREACAKNLEGLWTLTESMECARSLAGQDNLCYGDSGAPLVIEERGSLRLLGLLSAAPAVCRDAPHFAVFTPTEKIRAFLELYLQ